MTAVNGGRLPGGERRAPQDHAAKASQPLPRVEDPEATLFLEYGASCPAMRSGSGPLSGAGPPLHAITPAAAAPGNTTVVGHRPAWRLPGDEHDALLDVAWMCGEADVRNTQEIAAHSLSDGRPSGGNTSLLGSKHSGRAASV